MKHRKNWLRILLIVVVLSIPVALLIVFAKSTSEIIGSLVLNPLVLFVIGLLDEKKIPRMPSDESVENQSK